MQTSEKASDTTALGLHSTAGDCHSRQTCRPALFTYDCTYACVCNDTNRGTDKNLSQSEQVVLLYCETCYLPIHETGAYLHANEVAHVVDGLA